MRNFFGVSWVLFFSACSPITQTNWSFLPPIENRWDAVQTFGGSAEDIAHAVIRTQDGGFAIVGNTQSTDGDFSEKTRAGSDLFLMKFSSMRTLEWTQTYGGSEDDRGHDLVQLPDGGFAVVGYSKSNDGDASVNKGQHDNWVFRTDASGTLLWEKSFGFLGHDHAYNILATSDGGLFFNGFLDVTASRGLGQDKKEAHFSARHGVGEFWAHKIDLNGNLQWRRYFGGTSNDRSYDALETQDGDFVLVGASESQDVDVQNPKGSYDFWIVKIDALGNLLWEKSIGGSAYDKANAVIETSSGDYLVLGQTYSSDGDIHVAAGSSDILLARLSAAGTVLAVQTLGGAVFETASALQQRTDGTLIILGTKSPQASTSGEVLLGNDIALYHTLHNGKRIQTATLSGSGLDEGNDLVLTEDGKVLVVGSTESNSGDFSNTYGGKDIFIAFWH